MPIFTKNIKLSTKGFNDIINITDNVNNIAEKSGITDGCVLVFVPGSTGSITTIEYEEGVVKDLAEALERIASESLTYHHNERWHDGNGYAHIRAAILGPSLNIPLSDGHMQLGTWQQVVFIDFDNRPRDREIIVKIMGD